MSLRERTILVTGAAPDIGVTIAPHAAAMGVARLILVDRDAPALATARASADGHPL